VKFYKFWAKSEATTDGPDGPFQVIGYDGSNTSMEEAVRRAADRAKRIVSAIGSGKSADNDYGYGSRPMREEIVQEIRDAHGLAAVITRNAYGSLVLNTARVMFVDVDVDNRVTLGGVVRSLWNKLTGAGSAAPPNGEAELKRIETAGSAQPGLGYRLYRTAGGFRLLITSKTYEPMSEETRALLAAFGSDRLYVRLCKAQECFRARLSAKRWRCGVRRPPSRFPWATPEEEQNYRQWEEEYHERANRFATCELIGSYGPSSIDEAVRPILDAHDRLTIQSGAPLA
jgi:hypothetical protein